MPTTCSGVLPLAKITSGMPWRTAMVAIHLGVPEVFERHVPRPGATADARRADITEAHLLEERAELVFVHSARITNLPRREDRYSMYESTVRL